MNDEYDTIMSIMNHYTETHNVGNLIIECEYSAIEDREYGFIFSTTKKEENTFCEMMYKILGEIANTYWVSNIQIKTDLNPDDYEWINAEVTIIIDK